MKTIKILSIAVCVAIAGLVSFAFINAKPKKAVAKINTAYNDDKGFAVIELFTSEGCSSCPPADEVAARIQKENTNKAIYILAFHVDYWNRLGWKDVFSSADYSRRQNDYARWLKLSSVYTPQVVVNGRTEFVGSQEGTLRNAIRINLEKTPKATLTLAEVKAGGNKATVQYNTEGASGNASLMLALVQKTASIKVAGGENGGRTLSHVQIVRDIKSFPLGAQKTGTASVTLPRNFTTQGWELIAFLQNTSNGEITAATRAALPANLTASN